MEKKERVEVFIPKGYAGEDPNFLVAVNGVTYLLPRGKKSLVPPCVAAEVERSRKAQTILEQRMDTLMNG